MRIGNRVRTRKHGTGFRHGTIVEVITHKKAWWTRAKIVAYVVEHFNGAQKIYLPSELEIV